jgi:hypothetical protein
LTCLILMMKHKNKQLSYFITRPHIPFLAFLILLLLTISSSFDFATSIIPGWHTTIFPPYYIWVLIVEIILLLSTIGYWLLSVSVDKINWILFAVHVTLTIPTVIFLQFPSIFVDVHQNDQYQIIKSIASRIKLIPVAWTLFTIGQIFFVIYFIRAIISKPHVS